MPDIYLELSGFLDLQPDVLAAEWEAIMALEGTLINVMRLTLITPEPQSRHMQWGNCQAGVDTDAVSGSQCLETALGSVVK